MTAPVVDLASRRLARNAGRACPACSSAQLCYPHRLDALAARLRFARGSALLVSADAVDDALEVIDGINRECLPAHARVGTPNNANNSDRRAK